MDVFLGEIQRGLVVRPASIDDHAMKRTFHLDDLIDSSGNASFFGYVGGDSLELAGEPFLELGELVTGNGEIDRVYYRRAVV